MIYSSSRDQYVDPDPEIDPDVWKGQVEKLLPYLAHFATSAVSACGLFVAVIY